MKDGINQSLLRRDAPRTLLLCNIMEGIWICTWPLQSLSLATQKRILLKIQRLCRERLIGSSMWTPNQDPWIQVHTTSTDCAIKNPIPLCAEDVGLICSRKGQKTIGQISFFKNFSAKEHYRNKMWFCMGTTSPYEKILQHYHHLRPIENDMSNNSI